MLFTHDTPPFASIICRLLTHAVVPIHTSCAVQRKGGDWICTNLLIIARHNSATALPNLEWIVAFFQYALVTMAGKTKVSPILREDVVTAGLKLYKTGRRRCYDLYQNSAT